MPNKDDVLRAVERAVELLQPENVASNAAGVGGEEARETWLAYFKGMYERAKADRLIHADVTVLRGLDAWSISSGPLWAQAGEITRLIEESGMRVGPGRVGLDATLFEGVVTPPWMQKPK